LGQKFIFNIPIHHSLKWSKKEAGSFSQSEVESPFADFFFFLKMGSFGAF